MFSRVHCLEKLHAQGRGLFFFLNVLPCIYVSKHIEYRSNLKHGRKDVLSQKVHPKFARRCGLDQLHLVFARCSSAGAAARRRDLPGSLGDPGQGQLAPGHPPEGRRRRPGVPAHLATRPARPG